MNQTDDLTRRNALVCYLLVRPLLEPALPTLLLDLWLEAYLLQRSIRFDTMFLCTLLQRCACRGLAQRGADSIAGAMVFR